MNVQKEKQIAWLLLFGAGSVLVGMLVLAIGLGAGIGFGGQGSIVLMALGPIMIVGGVIMAGWGVFSGHYTNRQATNASVMMVPNCYVVARFAVNQLGEMIFDNFDFDAPRARYYVRLKMPDGRDEEFECSHDLLLQVGEGMVGNVQVKGRWLGSFVPVPRT